MKRFMSKLVSCVIILCLIGSQAALAETVYYYHTDPVGTPLAITNQAGIKVWEADYLPFGEVHTETGAANDRKFVGKERDEESNLDYFGARYHYAKIGRFLAPDPVRAVDAKTGKIVNSLLLNPQRANVYAYSLNNPYSYVDEDGNFPIAAAFVAAKIGALIVSAAASHFSLSAADSISEVSGNGGVRDMPQARAAVNQALVKTGAVAAAEANVIVLTEAGVAVGGHMVKNGANYSAIMAAAGTEGGQRFLNDAPRLLGARYGGTVSQPKDYLEAIALGRSLIGDNKLFNKGHDNMLKPEKRANTQHK